MPAECTAQGFCGGSQRCFLAFQQPACQAGSENTADPCVLFWLDCGGTLLAEGQWWDMWPGLGCVGTASKVNWDKFRGLAGQVGVGNWRGRRRAPHGPRLGDEQGLLQMGDSLT